MPALGSLIPALGFVPLAHSRVPAASVLEGDQACPTIILHSPSSSLLPAQAQSQLQDMYRLSPFFMALLQAEPKHNHPDCTLVTTHPHPCHPAVVSSALLPLQPCSLPGTT